jgi:glyoxylase-like metal-dependent hydrolase (beta-lactamase superfamily II)
MESHVVKQEWRDMTTTGGTATKGEHLRQLSEHVFVFEDTCNVLLVSSGEAGLLIDAGSGAVARHVADAGVTSLEWVLHTHHHRDQCWGTPRIVAEYGAQVAVPEHERYLFESAREHWRTKRIFDNYNDHNTFFAPGQDIPVDAVLEDYEEFRWRGITFFVLPAKGHTLGSSTLLADIDGRRIAFTGDLLSTGGHLYQLHAMEYGYGDMNGVLFTLQSLQALRRRQPGLILPSHGASVEAVADDVENLEKRLLEIARLVLSFGETHDAFPNGAIDGTMNELVICPTPKESLDRSPRGPEPDALGPRCRSGVPDNGRDVRRLPRGLGHVARDTDLLTAMPRMRSRRHGDLLREQPKRRQRLTRRFRRQ